MGCPLPTEGAGEGAPERTGVGETSVACSVGVSPNGPAGTIVDVDVDAEVPRDDGVVGRLGIDAVAGVDGEEEEGGGNGDRERRPRGVRTGGGVDNCCLGVE